MVQEAAFQLYRPVLAGAAPPPLPASVANGIAAKEEGEEEGEIAEPMAVDDAGGNPVSVLTGHMVITGSTVHSEPRSTPDSRPFRSNMVCTMSYCLLSRASIRK